MGGTVIVDGANVVGSRPDGWWRDRPGAALRLATRLAAGVPLPGAVVLVLEGAARQGVPEGPFEGISVVHAAGSGDDRIVALASSVDAPVTVVTADRGLRDRVIAVGASVVGPRALDSGRTGG
jgi:hypothetical protein